MVSTLRHRYIYTSRLLSGLLRQLAWGGPEANAKLTNVILYKLNNSDAGQRLKVVGGHSSSESSRTDE
jgi:hypothetical protein